MKTLAERFWEKVDKADKDATGCWNWTGASCWDGYGKISVYLGGQWRFKQATHVAWFLETGSWPQHQMCHTCDNPGCVRVAHLWDGTQKENMSDAMRKGHMISSMKGRKLTLLTRAKMTKAQLARMDRRFSPEDIKAIRAATCFQRITAAQYGVSTALVNAIKLGKLYP